MAALTGQARKQQPIWWRNDSLVHNVFMLWKLLFWTPQGPRMENAVFNNGIVLEYKYFTWEALLFAAEEALRDFRFRVPIRIHVPMVQVVNGFQIPVSPYLFAITFDMANGASTPNPNPSTTITRGTGASDYVGLADLDPYGSARTCSGVTWGGASMTQLWSQAYDITIGFNGTAYIFYTINPPSGAQTVTATTTSQFGVDAITFSGVDQTNPFDPDFGGAGINFTLAKGIVTSGSTLTLNGTTHVDNSLLVGFGNTSIGAASNWSTATTATYGTHAVVNVKNVNPTTPAGATTAVLKNNDGVSNYFEYFMSALQPSSGTTTVANNLALLGVG